MSELLCECCPMSVDQALEYVESGRPGRRRSHAAHELAKELRRLRSAVEKLADKDQTFHIAYGNDRWVKVSDVLAILEVSGE